MYSLLACNAVFSLLTVKGFFSILSVNSFFAILSINSAFSIGCSSGFLRACLWADDNAKNASEPINSVQVGVSLGLGIPIALCLTVAGIINWTRAFKRDQAETC